MPTIVIATDFSEVAENAAKYACDLALDINAGVIVLHTYAIPVMFNDLPVPTPLIDAEGLAEESMKALLNHLTPKYPQLNITSIITYGNLIDALDAYSEENGDPFLVIAGNGYNPENHAWLDSNLIQLVRHAQYPVLAIPAETTFTQVRKLCFAYDNKYEGSGVALLKLREIALLLEAELHILNVRNDAMVKENTIEIADETKEILLDVKPVYHLFYEHDIDAAVQDFVSGHLIDWLVVMPRKHSFFDNLFHKSHTKAIVNNSLIPLLALHEN